MAEKENKAGRWKSILLLLLVFGPASLLIFVSLNKCEHKFETLPSYGELKDFEFIRANGEHITPETQKGKITLYTTLQLSCPNNCAIDVAKFNLLLYQHYRKNRKKLGHIEIVSILTDEFGNAIDDLEEAEYILGDIIPDYDPEIWKIAAGDPKQIYNITSNGINLYEQVSDTAFANKPFLETMLIVDKQNKLRLVRRGNVEGLIRDFKEHVALLQKQYDKEDYAKRKNQIEE